MVLTASLYCCAGHAFPELCLFSAVVFFPYLNCKGFSITVGNTIICKSLFFVLAELVTLHMYLYPLHSHSRHEVHKILWS